MKTTDRVQPGLARIGCVPGDEGSRNPAAPLDEATAVRAMAALAQPQRLRVFRALVGAGPSGLHPGVLSTALGVPSSTLSFHLKELAAAELVSQQRVGRHLVYRPEIGRMNALIDYLGAHCCEGSACGASTASAPVPVLGCVTG